MADYSYLRTLIPLPISVILLDFFTFDFLTFFTFGSFLTPVLEVFFVVFLLLERDFDLSFSSFFFKILLGAWAEEVVIFLGLLLPVATYAGFLDLDLDMDLEFDALFLTFLPVVFSFLLFSLSVGSDF